MSLLAFMPSAAACATDVLVDGRPIAVRVLGESGPVIVLESGQGDDMSSWDNIVSPIARCARVVTYDRPGNGRSPADLAIGPILAEDVAENLDQLLDVLGLAPPFVLVGHSLGGLYIQSFARRYPADVAAVVLVDATSPLEPPGVFGSSASMQPGSTAEAEDRGVEPSIATMRQGPPFPPVPLVVLVALNHGVPEDQEALWQDVQVRTALLSPNSQLEIVEGSGHYIQNDRPYVVINAILSATRAAGYDVSHCLAEK